MADDLKAFFAESAIKAEEVEYVASKRFVDANRQPIPWKIAPITQEKQEELLKESKKKEYVPGTRDVKVTTDNDLFVRLLVTTCVKFPNLDDAALQDSYGAVGAQDLIEKMLTPGEYLDLANTVQQVCGYEVGMSDKIKRAKN